MENRTACDRFVASGIPAWIAAVCFVGFIVYMTFFDPRPKDAEFWIMWSFMVLIVSGFIFILVATGQDEARHIAEDAVRTAQYAVFAHNREMAQRAAMSAENRVSASSSAH